MPPPQIQRSSRRHSALYNFTCLLTYLLTQILHPVPKVQSSEVPRIIFTNLNVFYNFGTQYTDDTFY